VTLYNTDILAFRKSQDGFSFRRQATAGGVFPNCPEYNLSNSVLGLSLLFHSIIQNMQLKIVEAEKRRLKLKTVDFLEL
jgi:hypothetical protein